MVIKKNIVEILVAVGITILLTYSTEPVMYSDSARYLKTNIVDPPIYPTMIVIMRSIFGTLNSVIILQTLLIGFSIIYFTKTMTKHFNLEIVVQAFVLLFLFLPIIKFYSSILTEPFGYAFSLLFVSFVVKLLYNFNYENIIWTSILVLALLLTRNQFIFLYPVIFLFYIGIFILNKTKKSFIILTVSFLAIVLIHNSISFINIYLKQDTFKSNNLTYVEREHNLGPFYYFYSDAIYISTIKDVELFKNQEMKKTLIKIFEEVGNEKALLKYYDGRGHYGLSLRKINNLSHYHINILARHKNTNMINVKKEISIKLIKANFGKYIKHLFKKFYDSSWLFVFVPFFMLLSGIISFLKLRSNISLLIIFLSLFSLANHSVIYLFGRVQPRYFIYTDFILLIFIFILFYGFLKKIKKN